LIFKPEDRKICESLLRTARHQNEAAKSVNELMIEIGKSFLGTPYATNALEREGPEELVINLRQMDCFTLVENVVALARLIKSGKSAFDDYAAALETIRYRQGRLEGYPSRLHYFSDWIFDNQRKGIVQNISRRLGGQPYLKKINFMTKYADRYPELQDRNVYRQMAAVERRMRRRVFYYIPKQFVRNMESRIADGDLIAVTTATEGLDVTHVGLAVHAKKKLHLLHASSATRKVVISKETLDRYLAGNKSRTGIMVARAVDFVKP
jgi:Protein of unknown function (DUF1460)